jgi:hypothetical protein
MNRTVSMMVAETMTLTRRKMAHVRLRIPQVTSLPESPHSAQSGVILS